MRAIHGGLALRTLSTADAPVLASWADDEVFRRAGGWSANLPREDLVRFWERMATEPPADLIRLAAEEDGELVGYADLHGSEPERRELGFLVGPSSRWGQRLGLSIAAKAVARAWESTDAHEIWAETHPQNARAIGVLRAIGMTEPGEGDEDEFVGVRARMRQFAVSRARWFAGAE